LQNGFSTPQNAIKQAAKEHIMSTKEQIEQQRAALERQIEALKAENSKLLSEQRSIFDCKVSEKGAVSVYGMGRFPVTLYANQWQTLFDRASEISSFIDANKRLLKTK
jgi:hypothetical protein